MEDNTVTLEDFILLKETDKAYLVKAMDGIEAWIPKSLVEYVSMNEEVNPVEIEEMVIPYWLARQKGYA